MDKQLTVISLCDLTGNMVAPWAEAGYTTICVDIQHSIRATKKGNYTVKPYEGGG